jgi:hypothetical protein
VRNESASADFVGPRILARCRLGFKSFSIKALIVSGDPPPPFRGHGYIGQWVHRNPAVAVASMVVFMGLSVTVGVFNFNGEETKKVPALTEIAREEARDSRILHESKQETIARALKAQTRRSQGTDSCAHCRGK